MSGRTIALWIFGYAVTAGSIVGLLSVARQQTLAAYAQQPKLSADWRRWQSERRARPGDTERKLPPPATVWFGNAFGRLLAMACGLWSVIYLMLVFALQGIWRGRATAESNQAESKYPGRTRHHE